MSGAPFERFVSGWCHKTCAEGLAILNRSRWVCCGLDAVCGTTTTLVLCGRLEDGAADAASVPALTQHEP